MCATMYLFPDPVTYYKCGIRQEENGWTERIGYVVWRKDALMAGRQEIVSVIFSHDVTSQA